MCFLLTIAIFRVPTTDQISFYHHWGAGNATIFHQHLKSPLARTPEKFPGAKPINLEIPKPNGHLEKTYHSFMDVHGYSCIAIFDLGRLSLFPFLLGQLTHYQPPFRWSATSEEHSYIYIYRESSPPLTTH